MTHFRNGLAIAVLAGVMLIVPVCFAASPPECQTHAGDVVSISGDVVEDGTHGTFKRNFEIGSGRSRELIDLGVIRRGSGFDGALAWSQDVSGATHSLNSDFARSLATSQAWLDARPGCPPESGAGWTLLGQEKERGRQFDTWRVRPVNGAPIDLWYDAATHRLDRAIFQQAESRLVRHFSDWQRTTGGHLVAFTERDEFPEAESEVIYRVQSVVVKDFSDDSDFSRPVEPHDAKINNYMRVTDVPYADDHRTRIYIPVSLNGRGPFTFELDNGGHFILDAPTAELLGLSAKGSFSSTGAGTAVARVGFVHVKELRIGDAVIADQTAKVRSFSLNANDRGPQPPRAGIIGLELFERFTVGIDRHRKVVTLRLRGDPYPEPAGQALPLIFDEDAPLVSGRVNGAAGNLMLDTGNAGATIIEDFWAERNGLAKHLASGVSDGEARYSLGTVELGSASLIGETLSYYGPVARGSEYTRSVAAVLGEPLLSRFDAVYDYGRNLVWLNRVAEAEALPFGRAGLFLEKLPSGDFTIAAVLPGSPAEQADLKKGDLVSEIARQPSRTLSRADANALFKQVSGTRLELRVGRDGGQSHQVQLVLRTLMKS